MEKQIFWIAGYFFLPAISATLFSSVMTAAENAFLAP